MTSSTESILIGTGVMMLGLSEEPFESESILTISFSVIFTALLRDLYLSVESWKSYESISFKFGEIPFLFEDCRLDLTNPEISPLPLLEEMLLIFTTFYFFIVGILWLSN
jgi:hypothetical protein